MLNKLSFNSLGELSFTFFPITVIIVSSPSTLWLTSICVFPGASSLISKVFSSGLK